MVPHFIFFDEQLKVFGGAGGMAHHGAESPREHDHITVGSQGEILRSLLQTQKENMMTQDPVINKVSRWFHGEAFSSSTEAGI